jgi:hypothetical protein
MAIVCVEKNNRTANDVFQRKCGFCGAIFLYNRSDVKDGRIPCPGSFCYENLEHFESNKL